MRNLGRTALLGSVSTAFGSVGGFMLRLIANGILARLLLPVDFGEFGLAMVYSELAGIGMAFSFSQALLQLDERHDKLVGTVFWMSGALAAAVFAVSLVAWPVLAYVHSPVVGACFIGMSAGRIPAVLGDTLMAAQQRRFRFHAAALVRFISMMVGIGAAIPIAAVAPGPGSLVLRDVLPGVVMSVVFGVVTLRQQGRAIFGFDAATARAVWRLGRSLFWTRAFEIAHGRIDQLVVGVLLGTEDLGLFQQARWIAGLPQAAVAPIAGVVALRTLSHVRDDRPRLSRAFWLVQYVMTRLLLPFAIGAVVASDLAVRIVLGPGWGPTAELLSLLAGLLLLSPLAANYKMLLFSVQDFRPAITGTGGAALIVGTLSWPFGFWWGSSGMVVVVSLAAAFRFAMMARATKRHVDAAQGVYLPTMLAAALASVLGLGVRALTADWSLTASGLTALGVAYVGFVALGLLFEGPRLREELGYVRARLRR